jgi:hypothetical protein
MRSRLDLRSRPIRCCSHFASPISFPFVREPHPPHPVRSSTTPIHNNIDFLASRCQSHSKADREEYNWNSPTLRLPMTKIFLFNATLDVDSDMSEVGSCMCFLLLLYR